MHRHRMSRSKSRRSFKRGAAQVHPMNNLQSARFTMRGGIRI